jgi:SAM-dependent methyltransferase
LRARTKAWSSRPARSERHPSRGWWDLVTAFSTGTGLPYDRHGAEGVHRTERMLGLWARLCLVPTILPALEGVAGRLATGALVADVGCGAGVALTTLADAYPRSTFHGYELSQLAVDRARARISEAGLTNVEVFHRRAEELPDGSDYTLVLTFDCLHDMTRPDDAAGAIRRAIADDGTWLIKEVRCANTWADNRRNPMLAMFLGFSIVACMSSALSEPGGAGLGTIGLPPSTAEELTRDAGFHTLRSTRLRRALEPLLRGPTVEMPPLAPRGTAPWGLCPGPPHRGTNPPVSVGIRRYLSGDTDHRRTPPDPPKAQQTSGFCYC